LGVWVCVFVLFFASQAAPGVRGTPPPKKREDRSVGGGGGGGGGKAAGV